MKEVKIEIKPGFLPRFLDKNNESIKLPKFDNLGIYVNLTTPDIVELFKDGELVETLKIIGTIF